MVTRHCRKNQEVFRVEVRFNTMKFKGKDAFLVIIRDITEQVNHIQSIEHQNTKLREIAWIHSHSVRRPLANIASLVGFISEKPLERPDAQLLVHLNKSVEELDLL